MYCMYDPSTPIIKLMDLKKFRKKKRKLDLHLPFKELHNHKNVL